MSGDRKGGKQVHTPKSHQPEATACNVFVFHPSRYIPANMGPYYIIHPSLQPLSWEHFLYYKLGYKVS